jgi:hypothetical protein
MSEQTTETPVEVEDAAQQPPEGEQAQAAKRNPAYDAEPLLEDLNLKKYIGDDGEPDGKGIVKAADRLVPPPSGPPSFDGGARKSAPGTPDMNQLLRAAAGRE